MQRFAVLGSSTSEMPMRIPENQLLLRQALNDRVERRHRTPRPFDAAATRHGALDLQDLVS